MAAKLRLAILLSLVLPAQIALAGEADVTDVQASKQADGHWRFDVTVSHADEGWEHYADAWQILTVDGTILGERILYHPHVEEQPFTRSLSGVAIPSELDRVIVRAKDSVHAFGGQEIVVVLENN